MKEAHMSEKTYTYIIIGAGLAGVSAIKGIREVDKKGPILLIGNEKDMPYDRPPLSKKLWTGKKTVEEIFLQDKAFYENNNVDMALGAAAVELNTSKKIVVTGAGGTVHYSKLLLATGGTPRVLDIPGGTLPEICYFRTLEDYKGIRRLASEGKKAAIIGGGFIGSEIAAALNLNKVDVTMIFPEDYLVQRIFPVDLGNAIQKHYSGRGITVLNKDLPVSFEKKSGMILTRTKNGKQIESDIVIAGIGIVPADDLAKKAGLRTDNGIMVDEYLMTSGPDIYAAGDNTNFISAVTGGRIRVEHWDNSIAQGKAAGRNMAGAKVKYDYIPYFFSDLFEFGYEAAGEINSQLQTVADWKKEYDTGVVYYLNNDTVRGIMLCNVWDKIDTAREFIRKGQKVKPEQLKGAIAF
jgi:3-phenylpropionate/trans-cinnamate dioxygenase ferredoxin reductase component